MGALIDLVGPLVGPAIRSFLSTAAGMVVLTILVMGAGVAICAPEGAWAMAAAGVLALVVGAVAGGMLSMKRAVTAALAAGLNKLGLGRRAMGMIFGRLLDVSEEEALGERGRAAAKTLERLPLSDAEARLRRAVTSLVGERAQKTGFRAFIARKIQETALRQVEKVTLAQFRKENAEHGGVDLILVRDELGVKIDALAGSAVESAGRKVTFIALGAVLLVSLFGSLGIREMFARMAGA